MAKKARQQQSQEDREQFSNFSLGIVNGVSDAGRRIQHLRRGNNVEFDPIGALGCRLGYRDIVDFVLPAPGHSLMEYYNAAGNRLFVAAGAKIYLVSSSLGYVEQTLPITPTTAKWSHCNINGVLVACQEDGSNPPIAYNGTDWLSISFPTPGSGGTGALAAGGSVDTGAHSYRIRWLFRNGASLVSALTGGTTTTTPGNNTVNITGIPISARSDYLGFQVERTKVGDTTLWFFVGTGASAAATTYSDTASDASLGVLIPPQPGPYGQAPTAGGKYFYGITAFNNLLFGWIGSNMHVSRPIADAENVGVGVFNFNALEVIPVRADDGARITATCIQVDRLVIGKYATSMHAVHASGADFKSLSLVGLYDGAGPVSTRGLCSHGPTVYWYGGKNSFYRMVGNDTRLWARREIGEYLSEIAPTREADIVLRNIEGRRILMAYAATPSTFNEDAVVYRLDEGVWTHYRDMRIGDILVRKEATEFAGARVVFTDPRISASSSAESFAGYSSHVSWQDTRVSQDQHYAQRVNNAGAVQWTAGGVVVTTATFDTTAWRSRLASDGNLGGVFMLSLAQHDATNQAARAHKLDPSGVKQWGAGGIVLSTNPNNVTDGEVFSIGNGELFVGWKEFGFTVNRLNAAGVKQMGAIGVQVGVSVGSAPNNVFFAPDDAGGAWIGFSEGGGVSPRISRINSAGAAIAPFTLVGLVLTNGGNDGGHWSKASTGNIFYVGKNGAQVGVGMVTPSGVITSIASLTPATVNLRNRRVCGDASGGVYCIVVDEVLGANPPAAPYRMRVHRLTSTFSILWTLVIKGGMSFNDGEETHMQCIKTGDGGAILVWQDGNGGGASVAKFIYATKINPAGYQEWGAPILVASTNINLGGVKGFDAASDGAGGFIAYWRQLDGSTQTLRGQRYNAAGIPLWNSAQPVIVKADNVRDSTGPGGCYVGIAGDAIPIGAADGYHVWSAFDGFKDEAVSAGTGGRPVPWLAELPEFDAGDREELKDFNRLGIKVKRGVTGVLASVRIGEAATAVPLDVVVTESTWGDKTAADLPTTLYWGPSTGANPGQPHTWSGEKPAEIAAGIDPGTTGTRASIILSADIDKAFELTSVSIDYTRLPDRSFKEG